LKIILTGRDGWVAFAKSVEPALQCRRTDNGAV
jgi:hypothetical protein